MGTTLVPVAAFTDDLAIRPDEANEEYWLGRDVTAADFAPGFPLSVYRVEGTDRLRFVRRTLFGKELGFAEGPEVPE